MAQNTPNYDFDEEERTKGIRFNYNTFPVTRSEETQIVVPVGAIFNPLESIPDSRYTKLPKRCPGCDGCFNKYCTIDQATNHWTCSFCGRRNLADGDVYTLAQDVNVEYTIPLDLSKSKRFRSFGNGMVFLYCVDLQTEHDDLESLKETLVQNLDQLPVGSHIGLVTYDEHVYIHENPGILNLSKITALRGNKDYPTLLETLELNELQANIALKKYFYPLYQEDSKLRFIKLIQSIRSSNPHNNPAYPASQSQSSSRPARAQGNAISISLQLLRVLKLHCHLFNFVSGPGTIGPGKITTIDKSEKIRSFSDITKGKAKYHQDSLNFYKSLVKPDDTNISISFFIASYDQVGIYEMKDLSTKTGGVVILNDSFSMTLFKMNFSRMFQRIDDVSPLIDFNSNCELKVITSKGLKLAGFMGHGIVTKNEVEDEGISDVEIGDGFGRIVKLGYVSSRHNFNVFFKVDSVGYTSEKLRLPSKFYIQFQTRYFNSEGDEVIRVVTVSRTTTNSGFKLEDDLDQECLTVLLTKQLIDQLLKGSIQFNQTEDIIKGYYLKFMKNFGIYIKNEPSSFKPFSNLDQLPNFFYNLIYKSSVLSNFNNTPDEFTYTISNFNRISTNDSLLMIQPILTAFSLNNEEPITIPLDLNYFKADEIILMDSFSHVLIHFGTTIAQWRDSDLDPEEYSHIFEFIEQPKQEAMDILKHRFPLSRYVITDDGDSQDRFLKSKLNSGMEGFSEDKNLATFYREMVKKVCLE